MNTAPSVFEFGSIREFLQAVFAHRKAKNRRYSQRGFAGSLKISSSMIGYLMKGQRVLSMDTARTVAKNLALESPAEEEYFILLNELDGARSTFEQDRIRSQIQKFRKRAAPLKWPKDHFDLAIHPHALSVLEACAIRPIDANETEVIALQLSISSSEVRHLLEKHLSAGLVFKNADGAYVRIRDELYIAPRLPRTKSDLRYHHTFAQADRALESSTPEERVYAASYLPIRKSLVPEFRRKIYALLDEFHDSVDSLEDPDSVYGLAIGFFKVLEIGENRESSPERQFESRLPDDGRSRTS